NLTTRRASPRRFAVAYASQWRRPLRLPSLWLVLGITTLTRLPAFFVALYSNDEATYSALAVRILSGALPHAGAVDHKPIGMELTYAAVYAIVGPYRLVWVRALLVLVVAATGWI